MKIKRILKPGQSGTKKLVQQYGNRLVCVRYRYDPLQRRKLKTIELIIDDAFWQPQSGRIPANKITDIRIAIEEIEIRNRVKKSGGKWNRARQVWQLPYKEVLKLGLANRIVE